MSEYDEQATKFLKDTSTTISMTRYPDGLKPQSSAFENNNRRNVYKITMQRVNENGHNIKDKTYTFDFFDSINNREQHKRPSEYDILACLDTYVDTDMTIDDFVSEYGQVNNKISDTIATYNACLEQTRGLKKLYSESELQLLQEIV